MDGGTRCGNHQQMHGRTRWQDAKLEADGQAELEADFRVRRKGFGKAIPSISNEKKAFLEIEVGVRHLGRNGQPHERAPSSIG